MPCTVVGLDHNTESVNSIFSDDFESKNYFQKWKISKNEFLLFCILMGFCFLVPLF